MIPQLPLSQLSLLAFTQSVESVDIMCQVRLAVSVSMPEIAEQDSGCVDPGPTILPLTAFSLIFASE